MPSTDASTVAAFRHEVTRTGSGSVFFMAVTASITAAVVLQLMAEGRSNLGIAGTLHLSVKTVGTHVEHILDKLGIAPSAEEHRRVLAVLELLRPGD